MKMSRVIELMCVTCLLMSTGCGMPAQSEVMDAHYADMGAVRANADFDQSPIVRGWIPEFLPEEAVNIQERHNVDSNEGWGKFSFSEIDLASVEKHWDRIEPELSQKDPNRFPGDAYFDWSLAGVPLDHFFSNSTFSMVIDIENKEGYFWQHPEYGTP